MIQRWHKEDVVKIEPFKENLNHKVIPMAQSILVKSGNHIPMLLSYDKNGIEKISDLSDLFSVTDKDILYGILGSFLDESDSVAYILVTEAWKKKVEKGKLRETLEDGKSLHHDKDSEEVLVFQWDFRLDNVRDYGSISYKFENNFGTIVIDYDNPIIVEGRDAQKSFSRASNLLGGGAAGENKN